MNLRGKMKIINILNSLYKKRPLVTLGLYSLVGLTLPGSARAADFDEGDFSTLFVKISESFAGTPGLIAAAAYITGVMLAVTAIIKLKQHFDNPDNHPLREVIARAAIAGALFALPYVAEVATAAIGGQTGNTGVVSMTLGNSGSLGGMISGFISSNFGVNACDTNRALNVLNAGLNGANNGGGLFGGLGSALGSYMSGGTLGQVVCYASHAFAALPGLIASMLYIAGLFLIFWGLLQLRDHLISPDKAPISQPLKKILVAGAFMAFPTILDTARSTMDGGESLAAVDPFINASCGSGSTGGIINAVSSIINLITGSSSGGSSGSQTGGLDCMMVRLVSDLWDPIQMAVGIFCYLGGIIIIAFALRRMMDNMDKGAKSPVGVGTIGMFLIGGALLSFNTILRAVTVSIFPDAFSTFGFAKLNLYGALAYAPGISGESAQSINTIITTVFAFSFLVGIISIVRGLFILKEVSNGGNVSLMAGITHILGGGAAVNLGPLVQAVQNTLGLSGVGIQVGATPLTGGMSSMFGM